MALVSVIMPCFNHGKFIRESAKSVLAQSHQDVELIIIDDMSRDDSRDVIRTLATEDSRVRPIFAEKNSGASASRNKGLRAAQGEYIGFCDADDIWLPKKTERQISVLQGSAEPDVTYTASNIIDENGKLTGKTFADNFAPPSPASGDLFSELCIRNFINIQTVLMRRDCLSDGIFDTRIRWVEDWYYWITLSRRRTFEYIPEVLANYRVHSRSTNVTQHRGYSINRYKVFHRILKNSSRLSPQVRAQVWYRMAYCAREVGRLKTARALFARAFRECVTHPSALTFAPKPALRAIQ